MFAERLGVGVVFTWPPPSQQPRSILSAATLGGSWARLGPCGWDGCPHVPAWSLPELDPHHEKHCYSHAENLLINPWTDQFPHFIFHKVGGWHGQGCSDLFLLTQESPGTAGTQPALPASQPPASGAASSSPRSSPAPSGLSPQ